MAADAFQLSGSYSVTPATGSPSLDPSIVSPIDEAQQLKAKHVDNVLLDADAPVALSFGGVANATLVILKTVGGKVRARMTSADGAAQSIPVDDFLVLECTSVPVTAIDLTRTPGVDTTVIVFLGEKS